MPSEKRSYLVSFCFFLASVLIAWQPMHAQNVVVSEYMNYTTAIGTNSQYNEWTELLVVGDNVDMRNYSIRDNNNGQTGWQPHVNFNNISFWQHMRAGTVIVLRHRCTNISGTPYVLDTDPSDGYLELCLENTFYFNGGAFSGTLDNTMNIASGGDIIQLRNSSGNHVHALSHKSSPASSWTAMSCPKINHSSSILNGESVQISPGTTLNDYGIGGSCVSSTAYTNATTASSMGLANDATTNKNFWRFIREPSFSPAFILPSSVVAGTPGSITFNWTAAVDPNPADGVIKYLILRNNINFFPTPVDGTTYTVGQLVGFGASVLTIINNSTITSYTDNTVVNGLRYYYKVYAYKFNQDNVNGNSYANERGSAYGTPSVTVNWPFTGPLPVELISFTGSAKDNNVHLNWATATEINNDFFTLERSENGLNFEAIVVVKGAGNSTYLLNYGYTDYNPVNKINYYRLKQTDYNGAFSYSETIHVNIHNESNNLIHSVYPNPVKDAFYITFNMPENEALNVELMDLRGAVLKRYSIDNATETTLFISMENLPKGLYFIRANNNSAFQTKKVIKIN